MPDIDIAEPTESKPRRKRVNLTLAATMLTTGLTFNEIAPQVGAKNGNSLKVALHKKGVNKNMACNNLLSESVTNQLTFRVVNQASEALRSSMADILQSHTTKLSQIPARANLKHIKQIGEAIEPLARTAKIVHGWSDSGAMAIVTAGMFNEQEQSCGVDGSTGSVPVEITVEQIAQEDKPQ